MQKYNSLDDLWCEWPEATTAIIKHVEENEPLDSKYGWNFESACAFTHHHDGYSVVITHTGYDTQVKSTVQLSTQAKISEDHEVSIMASRRCVN